MIAGSGLGILLFFSSSPIFLKMHAFSGISFIPQDHFVSTCKKKTGSLGPFIKPLGIYQERHFLAFPPAVI